MVGGSRMVALAGAALAAVSASPQLKIYGAENIERYLQRHGRSQRRGTFDPSFNRHTGERHGHAREIERRLRQAERVAANRLSRTRRYLARYAGDAADEIRIDAVLSRRGRKVPA